MSAQIAADLRAAAEVLRRDGWRQEEFGEPDGCKCLYGAINYVVTGGERVSDEDMDGAEIERANERAKYVFPLVGAVHPIDIAMWNDDGKRTADEVIAALEAAADAAEAKS